MQLANTVYAEFRGNGLKWQLSEILGGGFVVEGTSRFVDGTNGVDTNDGSQGNPFKTITAAVAASAANDAVIVAPGSYSEAVTVSVAGLRLLGAGTVTNAVKWTSATDTSTLTIAAANVEVAGFKFTPPVYTANVATTSIALSNAAYAYIHDNRFQGQTGSYNAIYSAVCNSDNVTIANNDFEYLNTAGAGAAILGVEAGGLSYSDWQILGNKFSSCVTAVNINGRVCLVQGNHFGIEGITAAGALGAVCTLALDLSGTSSGANLVHGNYLGGAYTSSLYKVGATVDDWAGNFNIAGITAANP